MVEALPEVLRHEAEGSQQRPAEVVEAGVAKVRVVAHVWHTDVGIVAVQPAATGDEMQDG